MLVSIYAIFSALLFSSQIGLFALKRTETFEGLEEIERNAKLAKQEEYNDFLKEFSANLSYLIVICIVSLVLFVFEILIDPNADATNCTILLDSALLGLFVHFFFNLLMVTKRFFVAYTS